jgi:hypothetical protein
MGNEPFDPSSLGALRLARLAAIPCVSGPVAVEIRASVIDIDGLGTWSRSAVLAGTPTRSPGGSAMTR